MPLFHHPKPRPSPPNTTTTTHTPDTTLLPALTHQIGLALLEKSRTHKPPRLFSDSLLAYTLKDPLFKVQLFRFIDAFPSLKSPQEIHSHLLEYLSQPGVTLPPGLNLALSAGSLFKSTLAATISSQIQSMAHTFIAGSPPNYDAASALPTLRQLRDRRLAFSIDLLGEACVSDAEAAAYQSRYLDLLTILPPEVAAWPPDPLLDTNHLGPIPRANISIKISALYARTNPLAFDASLDGLEAALAPLLLRAAETNTLINFDMEQHAFKDLTLALFMRCAEKYPFPAGIALQAYLRSIQTDAQSLIAFSQRTGRQFTVRLIKGAYWDYETIHAEEMGWPSPVWSQKPQTDLAFENASAQFIAQIPRTLTQPGVHLALGSHNLRSIAHALALLQTHDFPPNTLEIQMLHGMADQLKATLVDAQLRLREYLPLGDLIPGMAYLVRRLLENTSNTSWLRAASLDSLPPDHLLAPPTPTPTPNSPNTPNTINTTDTTNRSPPFTNTPTHNFSLAPVRTSFAHTLAATPLPHVPNSTTLPQALAALTAATAAFPKWKATPVQHRADILLKTAALMLAQRDTLAAIIIRESHKTWPEADADVCEAIDFCNYYARQALSLLTPQPLPSFSGELNALVHQPRGPALVIAPWNFPLAILTGMTVAALVTGNTVLVKPAEQSPAIAQALVHLLHQAGAPRDVLHFLPGPGETIAAPLVRDPRIALIAFTGSKAVGLDILQAAALTPPDQPHLKRVICEMGGKNAIIVDTSADLDEAVLAVRKSAFSYAGQKCSACSRLILLDPIHDPFLARLIESTKSLTLGPAESPTTDIPPVIDPQAAQNIWHHIQRGQQEATLAYPTQSSALIPHSSLIPPHIFTNVLPHHHLAQEEIFGPVLAVLRATSFDHALELANASSYKLTGGLFSRTPSHLQQARERFNVGNLYLNRHITGALVARQPFGGFALSGLGSKAGGPHYLLHFLDPRTITENTLRHGFAPTPEADRSESTL